jgi:hypothetical protein
MNVLLAAQLALACYLCGLVWVVQLAIYPLFARIGRAEFTAYHAAYTKRITWAVGPAMLAEFVLSALMVFRAPASPWAWTGAGLVALVWLSTACLQVPLHNRLATLGPEPSLITRLVATNWLRTAAWTVRAVVIAAQLQPAFSG